MGDKVNSAEKTSTFEKGKIRSPTMVRRPENMDYVHTLMYGRYTKDLGDYAKKAASKTRIEQRRREAELRKRKSIGFTFYTENVCCQTCKAFLLKARDFIFSKVGEDWIFLAMLGVSMALCSFAMDYTIEKCQAAHLWLYQELNFSPVLQYLAWVSYTLVFVLFSTGFTHLVAPQAIGSGIPEMKTILRGVVLKEYLTFRTLISKMVGLTTSLGSGLPIGKEGPFVHVASIMATLLSKLVTSFRGIYENESRNSEMLAAACAVGVACTFAAPIGGVLFSIEVTATYFAVRNYWRGFFSAVCGALVFRLLAFWFTEEETVTALFKTRLRTEFAFDAVELFAFATVGLICGFGGALFVYIHRRIIKFMRLHKRLSNFLQKNRFIYPAVVSFLISTITFPLGFGQFMAGHVSFKTAINQLFSNFTWSEASEKFLDIEKQEVVNTWSTEHTNIFITLTLYVIMQFCMAAISNTLPIAAGVFTPVFAIGAAFGRLVGEAMAVWFPDGVHTGDTIYRIVPGGYAVVGAAALSGSVTHTISTAVIVFELTGQITHVLPAVIAVLISNAVANGLAPSIYDSMIQIKRLPYLPDFIPTRSNAHNIFVEDIMVRNVKFISYVATYGEMKELLEISPNLRSFPLVDVPESMILLGSIQRPQLELLLESHLSRERRLLAKAAAIAQAQKAAASEGSDIEELHIPTPSEVRPLVKKSRFEVTKVNLPAEEGTSKKQTRVDVHAKFPRGERDLPVNPHNTVSLPMRSILKKSTPEPFPTPQHKKSHSLSDLFGKKQAHAKKGKEPPEKTVDMTDEEVEHWEEEQLKMKINFEGCQIDPAPFQLVERTSLHKVHSLFSLLGLSHAYVTNVGRLMGVVALKEVRKALQKTGMGYSGEEEVEEQYFQTELVQEQPDLFNLRRINSQVDKDEATAKNIQDETNV